MGWTASDMEEIRRIAITIRYHKKRFEKVFTLFKIYQSYFLTSTFFNVSIENVKNKYEKSISTLL